MGFNFLTLLSLPFGLIIPALVLLFFIFSKKKANVAFSSIGYGVLSFFASVVAVFIVFVATNTLFLSAVRFEDDSSGMGIAGTIIIVLIAVLFVACESLKMVFINKFSQQEQPVKYASLGFSAGVIIAQNLLVFVALNIFSNYEMEAAYALFSGAIILVTGIMYTAVSIASEIMLKDGHKGPAYAISAVYYLFWISAILFVKSTVLLYIALIFFFIVSLVLSGVFVIRSKKAGSQK